jgi:hypothetical protein
MKKETIEIKFSISLDGKPEQDLHYEAAFFGSNGGLIDRKPVKAGGFALTLPSESLKTARLLIYPVNPAVKDSVPQLSAILKQNAYEPVLPLDIPDNVKLPPIPEPIWRCWLFCKCVVTGTVWNSSCNPPSLVPNARVHICTVESLLYWIKVLSNDEILSIRDDIKSVLYPVTVTPAPPPGVAAQLPDREAVRVLKENMPAQNLVQFYSPAADQVRAYLLENIIYFHPILCYFPRWRWLISDEVGIVQTNNAGVFTADLWYRCCEKPGIYIWVEYNIGGVWQTVYRPFIGCAIWWDYVCGTNINIYLDDPNVPCIANPTYTGNDSAIFLTTIGNNISFSQIVQSASNQGLIPSATPFITGDPKPNYAPFGGQLEPRVLFGANIEAGNYYYRWSYCTHGTSNWIVMDSAVIRHYQDAATLSLPSVVLGPTVVAGVANLFQVQPVLGPGGALWALTNDHVDLPTAFLQTVTSALAAGLYDLKFELFDSTGTLVDLTAAGIELLVIDPSINAPFNASTLTTIPAPLINLISAAPGNPNHFPVGDTVGFVVTIMVDNEQPSASITPITSDGAGSCGCGFVSFETLLSPVYIQYVPYQPNNNATFQFSISGGPGDTIVHEVSGNLLDAYTTVSGALPSTALSIGAGDQLSYILYAGDLLNGCTQGAFGCQLTVWSTATDGYTGLYDSQALAGFALITQQNCE